MRAAAPASRGTRDMNTCVANFVGACGRRPRPQRVSGEATRGSCAEASSDEHGMADGCRLKRQDARAQNMLRTRAGGDTNATRYSMRVNPSATVGMSAAYRDVAWTQPAHGMRLGRLPGR